MNNDPTFQAALDLAAKLRADLQEIESFIKVHQRLSAAATKPTPQPPVIQSPVVAKQAESAQQTKPTPVADILQAAREILRAKGKPMLVGDLYDALAAKGVVIGGKNPRNNLGAKLAGAADLKTRRGVGWFFKKGNGAGVQGPAPLRVSPEGGAGLPGVAVTRPVPVGLSPTPLTRSTGTEHSTANGQLRTSPSTQLPDRNPG